MLKTFLHWLYGGRRSSDGSLIARRQGLNREIMRLSVANIGLLFLWGSACYAAHPDRRTGPIVGF